MEKSHKFSIDIFTLTIYEMRKNLKYLKQIVKFKKNRALADFLHWILPELFSNSSNNENLTNFETLQKNIMSNIVNNYWLEQLSEF